MERRKLLKTGAGVVAMSSVAALEDGCAHQAPPEVASPLSEPWVIDQVVTGMDRRLAWIDRHQLGPELAPKPPGPLSPEQRARHESAERLFRQSLRTLYVTGRFMDLPDEVKTHPAVQARVAGAQGEMDEAVFGVTQLLESMGPEQHRAIQAALRANPDLGEQLAKVMDEPARDDGIPFRRRMSVRTTTMSLTDQMKAQSPALTIDPVVRRVRRLAAQPHDGTGIARLAAAKLGEEAFWQHQDRLANLAARWERQLAQATPQPYDGPPPAGAPPVARPAAVPQASDPAGAPPPGALAPAQPSSGHRVLSRGGYIMGFGAGSVGVGLIFAGLNAAFSTEVFLWPALIFGVTIGPILLVIGLIVVIVGGIMIASE